MKGIVIALTISLFFALAGFLLGSNPIAWGILTFLGQCIVSYLFSLGYKTWAQVQVNKLEVERLNEMERNRAVVKCANCKEENLVDIDLRGKNTFRCTKCNTQNSVYVEITNAIKTEMLDTSGLITTDLVDILKEESKVQEKTLDAQEDDRGK